LRKRFNIYFGESEFGKFQTRKEVENMKLYQCLESAQNGNSESLIDLIKKFDLSFKKYARKLSYPEAETDLIIEFIILIQKVDLKKFDKNNEGGIIMYLYTSIKNKHIELSKRYIRENRNVVFIPDIYQSKLFESNSTTFNESSLVFFDLISKLTSSQKEVLILKFHYGYSDSEISERMNISRQAVNRTKNRALETLRSQLAPERR
jgi:RNA polymerase sigma factor (sigma-70 family)